MRLWPRNISGWIGLALFLLLVGYLLYPILTHDREHAERTAKEFSHLRMIGNATLAYAADHDGLLPEHVSRLKDTEHGYIPAETDMNWFQSPFLENAEMAHETVDAEPPTDWYMHGHYHFCPTTGLILNDIDNPADFVLAYGSRQGDPPQRSAVFLDGSARWVSPDELREFKERQEVIVDPE